MLGDSTYVEKSLVYTHVTFIPKGTVLALSEKTEWGYLPTDDYSYAVVDYQEVRENDEFPDDLFMPVAWLIEKPNDSKMWIERNWKHEYYISLEKENKFFYWYTTKDVLLLKYTLLPIFDATNGKQTGAQYEEDCLGHDMFGEGQSAELAKIISKEMQKLVVDNCPIAEAYMITEWEYVSEKTESYEYGGFEYDSYYGFIGLHTTPFLEEKEGLKKNG